MAFVVSSTLQSAMRLKIPVYDRFSRLNNMWNLQLKLKLIITLYRPTTTDALTKNTAELGQSWNWLFQSLLTQALQCITWLINVMGQY